MVTKTDGYPSTVVEFGLLPHPSAKVPSGQVTCTVPLPKLLCMLCFFMFEEHNARQVPPYESEQIQDVPFG